MGASIFQAKPLTISNEPRTNIKVKGSSLKAITIAGDMIPRVIDEIPILAVAATQSGGTTIIRDAKDLRVKESDRIAAVADNLARMGAKVKENEDGLEVTGPGQLKGTEIDSYGDHRIAMAFAVAALVADGETVIRNSECVDISFPGFFDLLDSVRSD